MRTGCSTFVCRIPSRFVSCRRAGFVVQRMCIIDTMNQIETWNPFSPSPIRCLCRCYVRPARVTMQDETQGLLLMPTVLFEKERSKMATYRDPKSKRKHESDTGITQRFGKEAKKPEVCTKDSFRHPPQEPPGRILWLSTEFHRRERPCPIPCGDARRQLGSWHAIAPALQC